MKKFLIVALIVPLILISCGKTEEVRTVVSPPAVEKQSVVTPPIVESTIVITGSVMESNSGKIEAVSTGAVSESGIIDTQTGVINQVSFSDEQIKEILTKIDENTKKQQEQEKNSTGALVQGDFKAEYLPSNDHTDDKIQINMKGNKIIASLFYTNFNNDKRTDLEHRTRFSGFSSFSNDGRWLIYRYIGYESTGFAVLDMENNNGEGFDLGKFISWHGDQILYYFTALGPEEKLFLYDPNKEQKVQEIMKDIDGLDSYLDKDYIYFKVGIYNGDDTRKYLKIYNLITLKEVFSKDIIN